MNKIVPEHLTRQAVVYVRQSTADQVANNLESQRRQYGLVDRARQLGWSDVAVIDDDLGRSGGGIARPGFEKLLAAICEGRVGAVVSTEASRLARNGRDWHTLLEFCGLVGSLIVDEYGVYDPRHPNDRLLLGMKGTISEMELSTLRQRSLEALKQKARRGELFMTVAVGYARVGNNHIEKDPDQRVREALALAFAKFTEMQSVRQVHLWFRHERIPLPAVTYGAEGCRVEWKLPVYNTILHILTNPIYAGAYAFGRTGSRIKLEAGRKKVVRGFKKERKDWEVLIPNHHEGYLSWADYCVVVFVGANFMSPTPALAATSAAITAGAASSTMAETVASRSVACGSTGTLPPRRLCVCNRLGLRRHSRHRPLAAEPTRTSDISCNWRSSKPATKSPARVASTMPSIPTIASLPPSSRSDGTSD
jgi:DNA invertase Pin-like site-specific DNA recombinase